MRRNLTVQLDEDVVRAARVLAAERGMSISALVAATLRELTEGEAAWNTARRRASARMRRGLPLGGRITATRDDWHDR